MHPIRALNISNGLTYLHFFICLSSMNRLHATITEKGDWFGYFKKWKIQKRIITCRILFHREKHSINNSGLKKKLPTQKSLCIWSVPDEDQMPFRRPFLISRLLKACLMLLSVTNKSRFSKKNYNSAEILIQSSTQDKIEYCKWIIFVSLFIYVFISFGNYSLNTALHNNLATYLMCSECFQISSYICYEDMKFHLYAGRSYLPAGVS